MKWATLEKIRTGLVVFFFLGSICQHFRLVDHRWEFVSELCVICCLGLLMALAGFGWIAQDKPTTKNQAAVRKTLGLLLIAVTVVGVVYELTHWQGAGQTVEHHSH